MRLGPVLRELHRSEVELGHALLRTSERHQVDHEIFHVARDLVTWSRSHIAEIARIGGDYGQDLDPDPRLELGLTEKAREKGSELVGRIGDADLLLLEDLRTIYMEASGVAMYWLLIAQAAQGLRHHDLLAVAEKSQPETMRQAKWAEAKLKESHADSGQLTPELSPRFGAQPAVTVGTVTRARRYPPALTSISSHCLTGPGA